MDMTAWRGRSMPRTEQTVMPMSVRRSCQSWRLGNVSFGSWWVDRFAPDRPWSWIYPLLNFGAATLFLILGAPELSFAFWLLGIAYAAMAIATERRDRRDERLLRQP